MADALRNEVGIDLDGQTRTMRATFASIRGIERDLKTNLVPLIEKLGRGDVGIEQAAVIVFHGLRGFGDTELNLDQVGEAILKTGLGSVMMPVVEFLSQAMQGVTLGKPQEAAPV
jgi:hypothetical protein